MDFFAKNFTRMISYFTLTGMEELTGFIERVVFASEDTGFTVAKLKMPKKEELISIVGSLPSVQEGETLICQGDWKYHPQFGRQFEVQKFQLKAPADLMGIQKYLESGMVKGIGAVYAKRIVDKFGLDTLDMIDKDPRRLLEVPGIGKKRVSQIIKCWDEQRSIREVMIFLRSHNVKPSLAQKIFKRYGEDSIRKVKENPYALAHDVFGIGFKSADELAKKLEISHDSPLRIEAGIEFVMWELSLEGHVCYPEKELVGVAQKILEVDEGLIEKEIEKLVEKETLVRERDHLWIKPLYLTEVGIAEELSRLIYSKDAFRTVDCERAVEWVEGQLGIQLAKNQKEAIKGSLSKKFHIITGGPGTGKSTITKAILRIMSKLSGSILLAAPTGRAAKRMSEITHRKAFTIHSLLEFDFTKGGFKKNRDHPLTCDLIIIDEASMIDTRLMLHLLRAIPSHARAIFIGDIDQLPSVGPGNVLRDMIASEKIPVDLLKEIFRQARNSKIITNAHRVNQGYFPEIEPTPGSDFHFIETKSQEETLEKILELLTKTLPTRYNYDPLDEVQVLSPMKKGMVGCENLNRLLQMHLNPHKEGLSRMGRLFHPGDKVMQMRNNYDKHIFNGDVGKIMEINLVDQQMIVNFDEKFVEYDFSELDELMLAYAVSVHKYQGSECPCIVMPIDLSHFKLLFRNLLYTGITRGRKRVVLVGSTKALAIAVNNDLVKKRYTGLKEMIQQTLT